MYMAAALSQLFLTNKLQSKKIANQEKRHAYEQIPPKNVREKACYILLQMMSWSEEKAYELMEQLKKESLS